MDAWPPGSPLRGKYLVRNAAANRLLASLDYLLGRMCRRPAPPAPGAPRRILLANGAHLGDVLLSTAVLPAIKTAFPDAEIGFLIGSWSREVLADHPLVARLHFVDHWKLNRSGAPFSRRFAVTSRRGRRRCAKSAHTAMTPPSTSIISFPTASPSSGKPASARGSVTPAAASGRC